MDACTLKLALSVVYPAGRGSTGCMPPWLLPHIRELTVVWHGFNGALIQEACVAVEDRHTILVGFELEKTKVGQLQGPTVVHHTVGGLEAAVGLNRAARQVDHTTTNVLKTKELTE